MLSRRAGSSVTRFGDLLDFGQVFKAFGNNYLAKMPTFSGMWRFSGDFFLVTLAGSRRRLKTLLS